MIKDFNYTYQTLLNNGVKVICDISMPISGKQTDEVYERQMLFFKSLLTSQYLTAIKKVLRDYEYSPLPQKFIAGQKIFVENMHVSDGTHGFFNLVKENIIVDGNTICNIYGDLNASFLFGHEMGHKIAKYKATDELYEDIARVLEISLDGNYYAIKETFADECGNMMSPVICEHGLLRTPLDINKRESIKKLILHASHR